MTRQDILDQIKSIRRVIPEGGFGDNETAHIRERQLWEQTLRAIAIGDLQGITPAEAADTCLQSLSISFTRWFA
jgi:hypothetical protein